MRGERLFAKYIFRFAAGLHQTIQIKPFAAVIHAAKADY
jgi:hypothetical protein